MRIFLTIVLLALVSLSLFTLIDESALKLHEEALERAMVAFGLAKGLNAVISLIQGTEISFTPVGLGVNFSVGEVLDPFNDMVERFSWVMLVSTISLGLQKLVLILSSKLFLQLAIVLSLSVSITLLWMEKLRNFNVLAFSLKLFFVFILLRFAAILSIYTSQFFYESTLKLEYETATKVIVETKNSLEKIQGSTKTVVSTKQNSGFFDTLSSKSQELGTALNIGKKLDSLEKNIEDASRNIINLITIFILQSLLMPLLYFWFMLVTIKYIFRTKSIDEMLNIMFRVDKKVYT